MSYSKEQKKALIEKVGLPTNKMNEQEIDTVFDHVVSVINEGDNKGEVSLMDQLKDKGEKLLEGLLDNADLKGMFKGILMTDNSDILNLLEQLKKLKENNNGG